MMRRSFLAGLSAGVAARGLTAAAFTALPERVQARATSATADLRTMVTARAEALSRAPFLARSRSLPPGLEALDYDGYRRIEFNNHRGLWRDNPSGFEMQPMHRGYIQTGDMVLNAVEDGVIRPLAYDPSLFSFFGMSPPPVTAGDIGFSGARILGHLGDTTVAREFLVFQGASYFRALAAGSAYGLSARGLAVRTADPAGEEFPAFTELWVERPDYAAREIIIHALLDGPSVTGAYMFTVRTGIDAPEGAPKATRMGVNVTLFPRVDLDHLGLAPLTSMYWYAPLERRAVDDYRQRVHDSDGLSICTESGEWQWRPLANPARLQVSSFGPGADGRVSGFGLSQRARDWTMYQDMGADYHLRPSCWVEPHAEWPQGRVELIEIPTDSEYHDNIVAYWRPSATLKAGVQAVFGYDLVWSQQPASGLGLLQAVTSQSGSNGRGWRQIVVDFARSADERPPGTAFAAGDIQAFAPEVTARGARVHAVALGLNSGIGGLRLSFLVEPQDDLAELSAVIRQHGRPVSETWLYRLTGLSG
ncbi:glucan biosynthesis protein G [Paracoccaceae bacterium Fryx2]|nr:glucan biosynthesis protein G [Paracoccaceae bacterium Fryx2]